jgi:hypothetical protein
MTTPMASERIWALVSGFPGEKRRGRWLLMFQAYIDDSNKGDKKLFVLAGYLATVERWAAFSDEWQRLLDMKSPHYRRLEYFKMQEMQSQADRERCSWFYRVIENHAQVALSFVVNPKVLLSAVREYDWPQQVPLHRYENPYNYAYTSLVGGIVRSQKKFGINTPIDFIFDDTAEKARAIHGWERVKSGAPAKLRRLVGDPPSFKDDKQVLPLQAADLYAWWVREWNLGGIEHRRVEMAFPWERSRDIPALHVCPTEADVKERVSRWHRKVTSVLMMRAALGKSARK